MMDDDISVIELVGSLASPSPSIDTTQRAALTHFAQAVLAGLARPPRSIPCRFFYDAKGSELFEEITKLEDYYPTRVETELLLAHGAEIGNLVGRGRMLVEFGSGSSRKTSLLIQALGGVPAYVPIDIAGESLAEAADWLRGQHSDLVIKPLIADFTTAVALPSVASGGPKLGFFSGSTIGNLTHGEASAFLANAARLLGRGSFFLIGVDLKKAPAILLPAYNDAGGVTAAFNLNLLARINRELEGDFDLSAFSHRAVWNRLEGRMEMHLEALRTHRAHAAGRAFPFVRGETIHTENSYKYTEEGFADLAARAGWRVTRRWVSPEPVFAIFLLAGD